MKKTAFNKNEIIKTMTYVEALEKGLVDYDDIDDFIHEWHDNDKKFEHLYDFLGMTLEQYKSIAKLGYPRLRKIFHKGIKK